MKQYLFPAIENRINNKEVSLIGVKHNSEFFYENEDFFNKVITVHDAIVLEQPVGGDFWKADFFEEIANIAYENKKKIYQVDPINTISFIVDFILGYASIGYLIAPLKNLEKNKSENNLSRRNLLKNFGLFAIGSSLFSGSLLTRNVVKSLETVIDYGADDFLEYGVSDYRNIVIAEGIEKICNEVKGIKKIISIHGAAHYKTVDAHLKNPRLRKKRLAYLPFDIIGNTKIREYVPKSGNSWELTREF